MFVVKKIEELRHVLDLYKHKQQSIGFVPTMGALHEGHLSLINNSAQQCDITVCSIFVNPTQFNNPNDLKTYPRPIEKDIEMLSAGRKCSILFMPDNHEMYPKKITVPKHYDLGFVETVLEGKFRPGHFQGVAFIVHQLLNIVQPDKLFMGQKDFQQCLVIKKLLEIENIATELVICPIQREEDGLAMSSRNRLLSENQRKASVIIYQCLHLIKEHQHKTNFEKIKKDCSDLLIQNNLQPEYIELANANNLAPLEDYNTDTEMIALIAAYMGEVRLIDNILL